MKTGRKSRIRCSAVAVLAAAAVALTPADALASTTLDSDRAAVLTQINAARAAAGVCPLVVDEAVQQTSQAWAAGLATSGRLSHNSLRPRGAGASGENVGMAADPLAVYNRFLASPGHHRNMMDASFDRVGVGIEYSGGRSWVTLNFTASNLRGC